MQVKTSTLVVNVQNIGRIYLEFMSPGTSHRNDVVERIFTTVYSWVYGMMIHAVLHENLKRGI